MRGQDSEHLRSRVPLEAETPHFGSPRPTIVCLCGSTRFGDAYRDAQRAETLAGKIVLTVGMLGHKEGIDMDGPIKAMLDELHLHKVAMADEVLVLNCGGYIGQSTRRELEYARSLGKRVRFLEPADDGRTEVGTTTRDALLRMLGPIQDQLADVVGRLCLLRSALNPATSSGTGPFVAHIQAESPPAAGAGPGEGEG